MKRYQCTAGRRCGSAAVGPCALCLSFGLRVAGGFSVAAVAAAVAGAVASTVASAVTVERELALGVLRGAGPVQHEAGEEEQEGREGQRAWGRAKAAGTGSKENHADGRVCTVQPRS